MATIAPRDPIAPSLPIGLEPKEALAALHDVRADTLELVSHLSDSQLQAVLSPIMSPLVWDLAHIAAYEDLWLVHRHGGLELLRPDLAELYDAFETPRSVRGEVELLVPREARRYLEDVRERTAQVIEKIGVDDGTVYEMVLRHELQHTETMRQTMALVGLLPPASPRSDRWATRTPLSATPKAGSAQMGTSRWHKTSGQGLGSRCPPARSRWAPPRRGSPTTTSVLATPSICRPSRSPSSPSPTRTGQRVMGGSREGTQTRLCAT